MFKLLLITVSKPPLIKTYLDERFMFTFLDHSCGAAFSPFRFHSVGPCGRIWELQDALTEAHRGRTHATPLVKRGAKDRTRNGCVCQIELKNFKQPPRSSFITNKQKNMNRKIQEICLGCTVQLGCIFGCKIYY